MVQLLLIATDDCLRNIFDFVIKWKRWSLTLTLLNKDSKTLCHFGNLAQLKQKRA